MRVEQNNSVQQFSALNAFKSKKNLKKTTDNENQISEPEVSSGVKTTSSPSLLDRIDVAEVRKCAESVGEFNLTDDDIKYGLIYGRSVIAEWLC